MLKRALLCLLSFVIFALIPLVNATPTHAQDEEVKKAQQAANKQVELFDQLRSGDQMNLETWYSGKSGVDQDDPASIGFSQIVLLDLYSRIRGKKIDWSDPSNAILQLIGSSGKINIDTLSKAPPSSDSLIGQLGSVIGFAFKSPPISSRDYIASIGQTMEKHGIVRPAYAQGTGFGFQNLLPVLPIWKAFRNVAYFVFILVFVLYGFMIMFRMKINPQNVATFQTAIPKIVTTLIVITFAYAIAGFLMDLMLVVFNLILSVFQTSGIITSPTHPLVQAGSGQGGILVSWLLTTVMSVAFVPASLIGVLTNLPTWVGFIISIALGPFSIILQIIIMFAVLYSYAKLIFKLFEAYITVLIQVIFSPIILLQDVFPGSQAFGNWVRNIAANLSVFPVTMIMFLLAYIFMMQPLMSATNILGITSIGETLTGVQNLNSSTNGLRLPLIGLGAPFGGTSSSAILSVVGFFIILMASKYVDMVKDALKVPPFKYGTAIGDALQYGYYNAISQEGLSRKIGLTGLADMIPHVGPSVTDTTQNIRDTFHNEADSKDRKLYENIKTKSLLDG